MPRKPIPVPGYYAIDSSRRIFAFWYRDLSLKGTHVGDTVVFTGGRFGDHEVYVGWDCLNPENDPRVKAHWEGYVENNKRAVDMNLGSAPA